MSGAPPAELIRRTWGESLTGQVTLGVINLLLALPGIAIIGIGFYLSSHAHGGGLAPLVVGVVLGILWFVAVAIVTSALQQIFVAGAYLYATEGKLPQGFDPDLVRRAFEPKR